MPAEKWESCIKAQFASRSATQYPANCKRSFRSMTLIFSCKKSIYSVLISASTGPFGPGKSLGN